MTRRYITASPNNGVLTRRGHKGPAADYPAKRAPKPQFGAGTKTGDSGDQNVREIRGCLWTVLLQLLPIWEGVRARWPQWGMWTLWNLRIR